MSYSPKINEKLVRRLYLLKHSTPEKPPMTRMVNEAVEEYLERKTKTDEQKENHGNSAEGSGANPSIA